ncbi:hypothetical protein, partial [Lacticaseibacillus paracasei]|uniref:hypothetical protein n=1 Tax=Lacticaseibacillus paracasei TaxID=1597 RepID=UPI001957732A
MPTTTMPTSIGMILSYNGGGVCTRISDRNIRELIYPKGVLKMTYSRNRYDQDFKKNAVRLSFNSSKPV